MVSAAGFEPATLGLQDRHPTKLGHTLMSGVIEHPLTLCSLCFEDFI